MTRHDTPRCAGCNRRIPRSEADAVLRRLDGELRRYYHTRCIPAALAKIQAGKPDAWQLTVRRVDAEAN
jgi:hypothetical protein